MEFAPQKPNFQDLKVKLLLTGGHEYTLYLKADSPLLHSLVTAIVARSQKQESLFSCLFQVPIDEGRASLYFPSEHLVGLLTEPPIFLQQTEEGKPPSGDVLASDYVQIENFLTAPQATY